MSANPNDPHEKTTLPAPLQGQPTRPTRPVEPEILRPEADSGWQQGGGQSQSQRGYTQQGYTQRGQRFIFSTLNFGAPATADGCLPGYVTLFLVGACLVQFGLLAAIGFTVFYAIGSAVVAVVRMQGVVDGRLSPLLDPTKAVGRWVPRCAVWVVCFWLTAWLAA